MPLLRDLCGSLAVHGTKSLGISFVGLVATQTLAFPAGAAGESSEWNCATGKRTYNSSRRKTAMFN